MTEFRASGCSAIKNGKDRFQLARTFLLPHRNGFNGRLTPVATGGPWDEPSIAHGPLNDGYRELWSFVSQRLVLPSPRKFGGIETAIDDEAERAGV